MKDTIRISFISFTNFFFDNTDDKTIQLDFEIVVLRFEIKICKIIFKLL